MVRLIGEDLVEFVDDVEAFVENISAFGDIKVVRCPAVEGFKLGIVPEKFRSVEDFTVQIDEVALDEDFSHFLGNFFAREFDFSRSDELKGKVFGMLNRFLDQLLEGR